METISINFQIPASWSELSDKQLRYVYQLIANDMSTEELQTLCIHVPSALCDFIRQVLLHLGHVYDTTLRHFLEFGIVNVSPVYGKDVALVQFSWTKHEMVVRGR